MTTILALTVLLIQGCAIPSQRMPVRVSRWVESQGGLANEQIGRRVSHVCGPLLNGVEGRTVGVFVLDSDAVAAYAWPRSGVYVTRGLVTLVTDDELAAAVAHELGHLVVDGHMSSPLALTGPNEGDKEERADRWGCCLLGQCGIKPTAMLTLLEKVKAAHATNESRCAHLEERIRSLQMRAP